MSAPEPGRLIALMCLAHTASMLGFSTWPTLIPHLQPLWALSGAEAGFVSGMFFGGYMVLVPFLSQLTDRVDARRVYMASALVAAAGSLGFALLAGGLISALFFQFLVGAGIAGTYMPGLKLLADHTVGSTQSRGVSIYTSVFGVGASLSIVVAGIAVTRWGWQSAFLLSAAGPLLAALLVGKGMPQGRVHTERPAGATGSAAAVRAVFAQPQAGRYILGYTVHCWELFGSRSWLVAFLTFAAAGLAFRPEWSPVAVAAVANLIAPLASIAGNEWAIRRGRHSVIWNAMLVSAVLTCILGFVAALPWGVVAALAMLHVFLLMGDSGALTAGLVASSAREMRGMSMAVHSTSGFGAGFISPLVFGLVLDAAGGNASAAGWGLAYVSIALPALLGSFLLRPRGAR